jgi:hypothetical protein
VFLRRRFRKLVFVSILVIRGEVFEIDIFFVLQIPIKSHAIDAIEALVEACGELGEMAVEVGRRLEVLSNSA